MITISGTITKNNGEYYISSQRNSGIIDTIPILLNDIPEGTILEIKGKICSYNTQDRKLKLYISTDTITSYTKDINDIVIYATICKTPIYRTTPNGKRITDLIVTDGNNYLPVIAWNKLAEETKDMNIGDKLTIHGRIQSRTYTRAKDNTQHTTYEISTLDIIKKR